MLMNIMIMNMLYVITNCISNNNEEIIGKMGKTSNIMTIKLI